VDKDGRKADSKLLLWIQDLWFQDNETWASDSALLATWGKPSPSIDTAELQSNKSCAFIEAQRCCNVIVLPAPLSCIYFQSSRPVSDTTGRYCEAHTGNTFGLSPMLPLIVGSISNTLLLPTNLALGALEKDVLVCICLLCRCCCSFH